ncbi:MAG: DUF1579 domain-containing protein [Syntrophobacteraceae bacterium]
MTEEKTQEIKMDMQAIMEVYKKLAVPGEPHKLLAGRTGSWSTRNRYWTEPDKPPVESAGACERKMLLDGRYLQEEFTGEMMGGPFAGIGITGYDNQSGKYVMAWIDSLSTGIYFFEGSAGADGRSIMMESHMNDPVKGPMTWRGVIKLVDDNTEVFDMRATDKNGKEERCETTYTRTN